jgi:cytidylate kinase
MPHDIIVAIDGFASSGKSTIAKQLAAELNYQYVDSGAFYRAVTLHFLRHHINPEMQEEIRKALAEIKIEFSGNAALPVTYLNGEPVEREIRGLDVSNAVSKVSTIPAVRNFICEKLKTYGVNKRIVMDGRDIGTVVFPEAELKVFVTAEEKTRTDRRFAEMKKQDLSITEEQITQNLSERDLMDSTRSTAPLKIAADAVVIDNTHLSLPEQFEVVLGLAKKEIGTTE